MCSMIISSEFAQKEKKARLELLKKSGYQMQPQMAGKRERSRQRAFLRMVLSEIRVYPDRHIEYDFL